MAWKRKYACRVCGYATDIYEGKGFMGQHMETVICQHCKTLQPLVVGGVIGNVAAEFSSIVGRLCLGCGSEKIRKWNGETCPKCGNHMEFTGEKEFWT